MGLLEYLENNVLLLDGAMGTLLQERGLSAGELPERWNLTHPDVVRDILRSYYEAGSNVVCTNTFGANLLKYEKDELEEIIFAAVRIAREAAGDEPDRFVALDLGPTGRLLKPFGDLDFEDAVSIFAETVRLGAAAGADLIEIATMNDGYETKAALLAAKENCDLPVFVTNAYGADGKLLTGAEPEAMVALLEGMGADAIGLNCSLGPKELSGVIERILKVASVPVIFKPNAGLPCSCGGRAVYDVTADDFAAEVTRMIRAGVRIAGGCCGTTPEYIRKLTEMSHGISPVKTEKKDLTVVSSHTHAVSFGDVPVLIGERINPTGKKKFKEALLAHDGDYILSEAFGQKEHGADVLDVNVGLPGLDEGSRRAEAVEGICAVCDLPLQIDTTSPEAMEKAIRRYNGKALINSVNGKAESMDAVFPIAKKYGGVVVALTLDEDGIPDTADGRVKIAEKILARAAEYGIDKKDIIFDTLAMTVSADGNAAKVTLDSLERITKELGCKTSLGISNVSFGLPCRDTVNATFFACALERGLSAAIMNPYSDEMMKTYHAYLALHGLDESCMKYIGFMGTRQETAAAVTSDETLKGAVVRGLRDRASVLAAEALKTKEPLAVISEDVIPALDEVGRSFEAKTTYLPQLLMSAEAAKSAFSVIKDSMKTGAGATKCDFVLATVKGDIHDIGKNIVKLLLENYGFAVHDLGRDVPCETIVENVKKYHAPLVGLSALMTTTVPAMEETIARLKSEAPWCRTVVGGAVLNEEYAAAIGADKYAKDAMETVRFAEKVNSEIEVK
ncbi:MAG: homocysteine S-methyltransferase family protein [Clostridia bacterium]|nr:homocysteine S-methyltransferase family protein [Clostridia bacterium]